MTADGSIIINTRINTAGFGKGATNLKAQFGSLGSSVKKLGGMIATAFSVTALVNFGKQAIELGSDLQEVQNVVNVTFTTMNEQVNKFAKNAAKTAGLSETMAKRYAGTFGAMAKAFQFTEAEAYDMSTSLTQLAGDVASFYNITQDEAYTKLKSVFTGETESLKDLGVVMTQTALDDFALRKGLSKTTSQMTEQEKVALRYQFVLEQLSTASGDFARTSDSWANQTRILSLQFDQLKATLGQGLINAITPAIKVVNELIARFQVLADQFLDFTESVFGNAGDASKAITDTAQSADQLGYSIEEAGEKAKKSLAPFDEIVRIGSESETDTSPAIGGISGTISGGNVTVGAEVKDNISPVIEQIAKKLRELIEPLQNIDFYKARGALVKLGESFSDLGAIITDALEWAWFNILTPLAEWAIEDAAPATIGVLTAAFEALASIFGPVIDGMDGLMIGLEPIIDFIGETALVVLEDLKNVFESVGQAFSENGEKITEIIQGIGEIISVTWEFVKPIVNEMKEFVETAFQVIGEYASSRIGLVIDLLHGLVEYVAGVFTGDWARAWDGVKSIFEGTIEAITSTVNAIIGLINGMLGAIFDGINYAIGALNEFSIEFPEWVPEIGGETWGFYIPTLEVPQIPYLAKGAVIPPNAPFYAVLGDQRHGTNIEAPLSTIQEAVAVVMEDMIKSNIAGHEATVAVLKEILEAILGIEIGDDTIGQAVARYNAKMAIIRGGNA